MSLWIQITSGKGPTECAWVAGQLSERLQKEASRTGFVLEVVGGEPGEEPGTFHSLLLELAEGSVPPWLQEHLGTPSAGWERAPIGLRTSGAIGTSG